MKQTGSLDNLQIGELAQFAGVSTDTVRYYERLGLLKPAARTTNGYRWYSASDLHRLHFIRRAKLLGLSLDEIRHLVDIAEEGECYPLRAQVIELLQRKIAACDAQIAELMSFKASLEERYKQATAHQNEPTCQCASFPATCQCLPVYLEETTFQGIKLNNSTSRSPSPVRPVGEDKQNRTAAHSGAELMQGKELYGNEQ